MESERMSTEQKEGLPNSEQIRRDLRHLAGESEGFDQRMLRAAADQLEYADNEIQRLRPYETAVTWTLSHIKHSLGDASTYGDTRKSADEIKGWVDAFKFFEKAINMRLDGN